MAHKGIRQLTSDEISLLTYDQMGFDTANVDNTAPGGGTFIEFYPGVGTDVTYKHYANMDGDDPHWIGIHNCGSTTLGSPTTVEVMAQSIVGDNLSTTGVYNPLLTGIFIELGAGDNIYGKFNLVAVNKTTVSAALNQVRLIRGV